MILNENSIEHYIVQIQRVITKHVNVNVKTIKQAKKIIVGVIVHVFVRMVII